MLIQGLDVEPLSIDTFYNGELVANTTAYLWGDIAELHIEVSKWSKQIYQSFLYDFDCLKDYLRERGVEKLVVAMPTDYHDQKLWKFWRMMGFIQQIAIKYKGRMVRYSEMVL